MYVDPQHRGQGVNKLILNSLLEWSRHQGVNEICLDVYEDNKPVIRAYEKAGFTKNLVSMRVKLD